MVAILVVLAGLVAATLLAPEEEAARPPRPAAPVALIAERVEALRGLEFERLPEVVTVTPEQARTEGLEDFDSSYPERLRRADETLYGLLGLLPPKTDLREVTSAVFEEQVGGYYDPRTGRLRVVEGVSTANRVLAEMTTAHELTHALDDQVFDLDLDDLDESGDASLAYQALVEGTATSLMTAYLAKHFRGDEALGGLLSGAFGASGGESLPPFVQASLLFPYQAGAAFVQELNRDGTWRIIDAALRVRPPASTEQVLHTEKYLRAEEPVAVEPPSLGAGWTRTSDGVLGEWQTREWLRLAGGGQEEAAAGWGGDAYALWERGARRGLTVRWTMDTRRDARELLAAARAVKIGTVRGSGRRVELEVTAAS